MHLGRPNDRELGDAELRRKPAGEKLCWRGCFGGSHASFRNGGNHARGRVARDEQGVRHTRILPSILPSFRDRKSTRLNSSHLVISYAVFCLKKKKKTK